MAHPATIEHYELMSKREKFADWVTNHVGTLECAIVFAGIGTTSIYGILTGNILLGTALGAFSSYFLQLVLLPLIMVSQNLQQRHAELLAEKDYEADSESERNLIRLESKVDKLLKKK